MPAPHWRGILDEVWLNRLGLGKKRAGAAWHKTMIGWNGVSFHYNLPVSGVTQ